MSNVDTLLDFDSPTEKGPGQTTNGSTLDPFDPFGPTPTLESKGDNSLLLNFDSTVQNGDRKENGGDNVNLLYEFESGNTNPLYDLQQSDDTVKTEDLAAMIKQQVANDDDDIVVTETISTDEDGHTTVVTTRRSRSYDSDRERSPSVEQIIEETTTSDDGMTVRKMITTTTTRESGYGYEDEDHRDGSLIEVDSYEQEPSLEEQSYERRDEQSYEQEPSLEEQSYERRDEQSYEQEPSLEEQSYERRDEQSYEQEPSLEEQSFDGRSEEASLQEEISCDERASFDESPSFVEQPSEEDPHKRRSMTPSPSSSDNEREETNASQQQHQAGRTYESLYSLKKNRPRLISDEHDYEVIITKSTGPHYQSHGRFVKQEEEIIKNGATFYRTDGEQRSEDRGSTDLGNEEGESQRMVKEEVTPGQIKSPFFGGTPQTDKEDVDDVERDPNIAREVRSRDDVHFAELSNYKSKFEKGIESQKISTVTSHELDRVRQSAAAGSLRNKFENVGKEEQNGERKSVREITPPKDGDKVVYEKEAVRDPNVVRSEDMVDEGQYMPKPGSSREILERFKSGKVQENSPKQRTSVIDEIQQVEGGVFENEPQINPDVVRSDQRDVFADLPSTGSTRNVLSKFKEMESSTGYVPAPRGVREITPPSGGKIEYVSEPTTQVERYEGKAESGVFESKPEVRPDVVKSSERITDDTQELPQEGFAKSAAALFRQKEAEAGRTKTASTGGLRQITPPRDTPVVYESEPQRLPDVVRSEDKKEDEALPQQGAAKNMLAKFKQWESSGGPSSETPRKPKEFTPPREGGVFENTPETFVPDYDHKAEGGVYENQPQHRDDVVRSEDRSEDGLPEQGMAKNIVAKFRQLGDSTKSQSPISPRSPHDRSFKEFTPPREDPRTPGVQPSDMPEQYQQASGGVSENTPQKRDDVFREEDRNDEVGLPPPSTTKNLLARFKAIQHDAKAKEEPKPVRKESPQIYNQPSPSMKTPVSSTKGGGVSRFRAVQPEKCISCQKTVYAMEKMEFNKNVYHKSCFKCSHCKKTLTPATFSVNQGILYCLNHFKQMFKTKGNYDEGFGREQHKKKWKSEPNIAGLSDDDHTTSRSLNQT